MESPFYKTNTKSIVMYLEPYLNTYYKSYQNIITLSDMPTGPLADLVTPISFPKLSPFQDPPPFSSNPMNCTYVLLRYPKNQCPGKPSLKNMDYFMTADDIPAVFSYLTSNGYKIDTGLTKMLYKSKVAIGGVSEKKISGDRKMICFFSNT
jgi:hypothetical protein